MLFPEQLLFIKGAIPDKQRNILLRTVLIFLPLFSRHASNFKIRSVTLKTVFKLPCAASIAHSVLMCLHLGSELVWQWQ
jgi:hypothetical protein